MKYRLDVFTPRVADVVRSAGGLLVDRAMAGWDVTVLVLGNDELRPLHILGVKAEHLDAPMRVWEDRPHAQSVAVAADLLVSDPRVRKRVLGSSLAEVTLWGARWPSAFESAVDKQHELSAAAKAFKAQALAAVGESGAVEHVEAFGWSAMSCPALVADRVTT